MQWFSDAMREKREAADERYRQMCRLNALDCKDAPVARRPARATPKAPVTPRATATATRKVADLPVVRVGPIDGSRVERRYLCWYTGGSDEQR